MLLFELNVNFKKVLVSMFEVVFATDHVLAPSWKASSTLARSDAEGVVPSGSPSTLAADAA